MGGIGSMVAAGAIDDPTEAQQLLMKRAKIKAVVVVLVLVLEIVQLVVNQASLLYSAISIGVNVVTGVGVPCMYFAAQNIHKLGTNAKKSILFSPYGMRPLCGSGWLVRALWHHCHCGFLWCAFYRVQLYSFFDFGRICLHVLRIFHQMPKMGRVADTDPE
jgi:hypothetical protein